MVFLVCGAGVWDGLLETRIKLHKILGSCNQLPQGESFGHFTKMGESQTEEMVKECELLGLPWRPSIVTCVECAAQFGL